MQNEQYHRSRRRRRKPRYDRLIGVGIVSLVVLGGLVFLVHRVLSTPDKSAVKPSHTSQSKQAKSTDKSESNSTSDVKKDKTLPASKPTDWNLVLVNRDHPREEMNPDVVQLDGIWVDSRIEDATTQFLAAAQAINPAEHLISGYRSVTYQTSLYNQYVEQEIAANPALDRTSAEKIVQTYSQPPTMSEHQTGLAIDLSDVDSLNQSTSAEKIAAIAPEYGFVLRFPHGGAKSTGVDYEDWHFRYVGVENAKYMTAHQLTLEDYLKLLA